MRDVATIREDLGRIAGAIISDEFDPSERPPQIKISERIDLDGVSSGGLQPAFDLGDSDYSEEARSLFYRLDSAVLGNREGNATSAPCGIDAIAWYVSFHFSSVNWGVYIPISSLAYLESTHLAGLDDSREQKWRMAFQVLLHHELFHFAADYMSAQWEVLLGLPCWAELRQRKLAADRYLKNEEALANAFMLRKTKRQLNAAKNRAITDFVAQQPPGYRDASVILETGAFENHLADLSKMYSSVGAISRDLDIWSGAFDHTALFPFVVDRGWAQCPVYMVRDDHKLGLPPDAVRLVVRIPEVVEMPKFRKALKRMSPKVKKAWKNKKKLIKVQVPAAPRFEQLKGNMKGIFSLYVTENHRAHLKFDNESNKWQAFEIGTHKEMDHG